MIMVETGLEITAAGVLTNAMLKHRLHDTVKGATKANIVFELRPWPVRTMHARQHKIVGHT